MMPEHQQVSDLCRELQAAKRTHRKRGTYASALKVQHVARALDLKAHAARSTFKMIEGGLEVSQ